MFQQIFRPNKARKAGEALFAAASAQARETALYTSLGAPDTIEGRFELTVLHVWLILRRLKSDDRGLRDVSQKLFDAMFASFDDALRELGVGDLVVGKKIRKMAENFYGRVQVYDAAMNGASPTEKQAALAGALARNVYGTDDAAQAAGLASYVTSVAVAIDEQSQKEIACGGVVFPENVL